MKQSKKQPIVLSQIEAWRCFRREDGGRGTGKTKVAVGYYRKAADDDGSDVYRQMEAMDEKASALGARIHKMYADHDGITDGDVERPGFEKLLKFLSEVKSDYVIIDNPQCLSDHKQELDEMIQAIEKSGTRVEFADASSKVMV